LRFFHHLNAVTEKGCSFRCHSDCNAGKGKPRILFGTAFRKNLFPEAILNQDIFEKTIHARYPKELPHICRMKVRFGKLVLAVVLFMGTTSANLQKPGSGSFQIAKLKYNGGGDWYANKTSLPNLIRFCNKLLRTQLDPEEAIVEPGSVELFQYPFVHLTGHGNVVFSSEEASNLRKYLQAGGFLHIDDNYGMDKFIRREMKKVFPELDFVELPFSHPVYHQKYDFPKGLPKVHQHDGKPPQGFGLLYQGRLVCFYSYECDLGNGWEDASVYNDPEPIRLQALQMGANLLTYALTRPD
jgi:hypothetical protein